MNQVLEVVMRLKQTHAGEIMRELGINPEDRDTRYKLSLAITQLKKLRKIKSWKEGHHLRFIIPYDQEPIVRWTD